MLKSDDFILTDGQKYFTIRKKDNMHTTTGNICEAKHYDTYEKAEIGLKSMKKTLRILNWRIMRLDESINGQNNLSKDTIKVIVDNEDNSFVDKIKEIELFSKDL